MKIYSFWIVLFSNFFIFDCIEKQRKRHQNKVTAIAFTLQFVITGSADKTLKLWKYEPNIDCIQTLFGHKDCVRGVVVISMDRFYSYWDDRSIREWNLFSEQIDVYYVRDNICSIIKLLKLKFIDSLDLNFKICLIIFAVF
jgi:WD40 repeat protein